MRFARRFLIAFACTLGAFPGASSVQAQPTKLLPNDTELIVSINLQQILKSEVMQANKAMLDLAKGKITEKLEEKGITKYLKKADFDLFRDLKSITFGVPGGRNNPADEGFILIEGNFDENKIEEAATEANKEAGGNLKVTKIANVKTFEIPTPQEKNVYIGILNKTTMIATSTKADFADAVARHNGTKESTFKSQVKTLLETVNAKQSISVVATSAVVSKLAENAPPVAGGDQVKAAITALKQLEGLSLGITIQKNIDFLVGVNAKDTKTASDFANVGNLLITGFRTKTAEQAKQDEKLVPVAEVVNTLRATAQGTNLVIRGQVSFEVLGKLLQNLPMGNN